MKILIAFLVYFIFTNVYGQNTSSPIIIGQKHFIHSEILNESREYWINLPSDYNKSKYNYPVLYLFDGQEHKTK